MPVVLRTFIIGTLLNRCTQKIQLRLTTTVASHTMRSIYSGSVRLLHPDAIGSYRTLSLLNIAHRRRTRYRVPSGEAIALAYTVAVVLIIGL